MWISCEQNPPEGVVVFVRYLDGLRIVVKDGVMMLFYYGDKNAMWPAKFKPLRQWRFPKKEERV